MTHTVAIKEPYLPTKEDGYLDGPYKAWCVENGLHHKTIYFGFHPNTYTSSGDILELAFNHPVGLYATFDCPNEAMLFKLTFGGK